MVEAIVLRVAVVRAAAGVQASTGSLRETSRLNGTAGNNVVVRSCKLSIASHQIGNSDVRSDTCGEMLIRYYYTPL
jgi:intracellular sulfur oxidation DsrE/DsrF family protein